MVDRSLLYTRVDITSHAALVLAVLNRKLGLWVRRRRTSSRGRSARKTR